VASNPAEPDFDPRFARQAILPSIGAAGQRSLSQAGVMIVGLGALGCAVADHLVRAGVGTLTLIDRDIVELSNLQRQTLFTEADAREGRPKAQAAAERLGAVSSACRMSYEIADVTSANAKKLLDEARAGLAPGAPFALLDGTDNFETRYLLNDLAVSEGLPLLYAGVLGVTGLSAPFLPGHACLRCVFDSPPRPGSQATCATVGVLGPAVAIAAARQASDAIHFLAGRWEAIDLALHDFDLVSGRVRRVPLPAPQAGCVCCGLRQFEFLNAPPASASLCGRNAVQISPPPGAAGVDLGELATRWAGARELRVSAHMVRGAFPVGGQMLRLTVFADGRVLVSGTADSAAARAAVARYVGA